MKLEYIKPFIESVENLFATMLNCSLERGEVGVTKGETLFHEVTALIGLSGPARGTVAITFPAATSIAMVNRLLGIESTEVNQTVTDGVGEIVNIVAGSAKSKFVTGEEQPIDLSLPNVVRGNDYIVEYPSGTVWLEVPFKSDLGAFTLQVTFEKEIRYEEEL
jgi:chemotaxis protein CheX